MIISNASTCQVSTDQCQKACGQSTLMASPTVKLLQQSLTIFNFTTANNFIPVFSRLSWWLGLCTGLCICMHVKVVHCGLTHKWLELVFGMRVNTATATLLCIRWVQICPWKGSLPHGDEVLEPTNIWRLMSRNYATSGCATVAVACLLLRPWSLVSNHSSWRALVFLHKTNLYNSTTSKNWYGNQLQPHHTGAVPTPRFHISVLTASSHIFYNISRDYKHLIQNSYTTDSTFLHKSRLQLECGPMPNVMVALPNIGGALCSMPQSLADAHCWSTVQ